ncbi:MAG: DUF4157 domain-containing protein, partial [Anaerolineae bacterium]|nr:DUF4157 domain-containing protein [Anaerolineae bacterium]
MAREPEKVLKPDHKAQDLFLQNAKTNHKLHGAVPPAQPETAHKLVGLQKTAGNQAILALLHTSGRPLSPEIQQQMERRFGHPLGQVRIHDAEPTAGLVRKLDASAVTIGQDIYFDSGKYQPHTESGQWLLSHELTHTLQQQQVRISPETPIPLSSPYTSAEQEAASIASTVMNHTGEGRIAISQTQAAPVAQRQSGHPHDRPAFEEQHV